MRQQRRTAFGASFVTIVGAAVAGIAAAACGGSKPHEPIHRNPPAPGPDAAEACKATKAGTPCEAGASCHIADDCGLQGYTCRDGQWQDVTMSCNPPPPGN